MITCPPGRLLVRGGSRTYKDFACCTYSSEFKLGGETRTERCSMACGDPGLQVCQGIGRPIAWNGALSGGIDHPYQKSPVTLLRTAEDRLGPPLLGVRPYWQGLGEGSCGDFRPAIIDIHDLGGCCCWCSDDLRVRLVFIVQRGVQNCARAGSFRRCCEIPWNYSRINIVNVLNADVWIPLSSKARANMERGVSKMICVAATPFS